MPMQSGLGPRRQPPRLWPPPVREAERKSADLHTVPAQRPCRRPGKLSHLQSGRMEDATAFLRSEEHTSELQSLMRISYDVFCLKKRTVTVHVYRVTAHC